MMYYALRRQIVETMTNAPQSSDPTWRGFIDQEFDRLLPRICRGSGAVLYDESDNSFLNAFSGLSLLFGIGHPAIEEAIVAQVRRLPYVHLTRTKTDVDIAASEALLSLFEPASDMAKVHFAVSGSEAIDGTIKIARAYQRLKGRARRTRIVSWDASYHGCSLGAMSVSGLHDAYCRAWYGPMLGNSFTVPGPRPPNLCKSCAPGPACSGLCGDVLIRMLEEHSSTIAAVLIEPVIGAGGVVEPKQCLLTGIEAICRKYDILLVVDEAATGFCRTGPLLAAERSGLTGDMVVLGKAMNGGYLPAAAIVTNRKVYSCLAASRTPLRHGASQAGNPTCLAPIPIVVNELSSGDWPNIVARSGARLVHELRKMRSIDEVCAITSIGLMTMLHFREEHPALNGLFANCIEAGVLAHVGKSALGLFPPLTISGSEIDRLVAGVDTAIQKGLRKH